MSTEAATQQNWAVLKPTKVPKYYSLDAYLHREERAVRRSNFFDGEIIPLPAARGPHNIIGANIIGALGANLKAAKRKFTIFTSNQKVYIPSLNIGRYPDVVVICEEPEYFDDNQVLLLNPLVIVEIASNSTRNYDKYGKLSQYKEISSFREYVVIEQDKCRVESQFREEPNLWRDTIATEMSDSFYLRSLDCSISVADIYENVSFPVSKNKKK